MSVPGAHPQPIRWLTVAAGILVVSGVAMLLRDEPSEPRTAVQLEALATTGSSPTPTSFPQPVAVSWEGQVTRSLVSGAALEIRSVSAPGGYFFAYLATRSADLPSEALVRVDGAWTGISCEYGRCAPEVDVERIEPISVELE